MGRELSDRDLGAVRKGERIAFQVSVDRIINRTYETLLHKLCNHQAHECLSDGADQELIVRAYFDSAHRIKPAKTSQCQYLSVGHDRCRCGGGTVWTHVCANMVPHPA